MKSIKLSDLKPDKANANQGTERGLRALDDSLASVGLGRSIVVDKNLNVVAGNKTLERAFDQGYEDAIVIETTGDKLVVVLREDFDLYDNDPNNRARKYAYADNRVAELDLQWDAEQLMADLQAGFDFGALFNQDEIDELLSGLQVDEPTPDPGAQVDRAEELQAKWQVERGQIWVIPSKHGNGEHRLMCGDSTDADDIERLLQGSKIDLQLSDPPYGINVVKVTGNNSTAAIGGAKPVTIGTIRHRKDKPFGGVKNRGTDGAANMVDATYYMPVYGDDKPFDPSHLMELAKYSILFGGNYFASKLPDSRCWIVWDKNNTGNFADAELAWTNFDKGVRLYQFTWNGLVREGSRDIEGVKRVHPTQKPVGLFSQILNDFSMADDTVIDCYLGSGTTLVACEQSQRVGYGMEIHPPYVAVTLQRLADMGLTPRLAT